MCLQALFVDERALQAKHRVMFTENTTLIILSDKELSFQTSILRPLNVMTRAKPQVPAPAPSVRPNQACSLCEWLLYLSVLIFIILSRYSLRGIWIWVWPVWPRICIGLVWGALWIGLVYWAFLEAVQGQGIWRRAVLGWQWLQLVWQIWKFKGINKKREQLPSHRPG